MRRLVRGRLPDGRPVEIACERGAISGVSPAADDAGLVTLLPGLVDVQVNGFAGFDVNEEGLLPDTVHGLVDALRAHGTTRFAPTIITGSEERIRSALRAIVTARRERHETRRAIPCINIEGPFLSPADGARGAHDAAWIRPPSIAEFERWRADAPGLIGIVTIAPEWPEAPEWIRHATAAGVRVALGHSAADGDHIRAAAEAGASLSTHLGNGVAALLPRHPNLIWAQLADDRLTALLIADGHHLPPDTFRAMVRAKGVQRCVLTSDAVALAGLPAGEYTTPVGGRVVIAADGSIRLPGSALLAGSGATLIECVRWAAASGGVTLAEAAAMACEQPAALLGIDVPMGLVPGAPADIQTLDGVWLAHTDRP